MQIWHAVHCFVFNTFYNKRWNWFFFVYFYWFLKIDDLRVEFGARTQTTAIY